MNVFKIKTSRVPSLVTNIVCYFYFVVGNLCINFFCGVDDPLTNFVDVEMGYNIETCYLILEVQIYVCFLFNHVTIVKVGTTFITCVYDLNNLWFSRLRTYSRF